MYSHGAWHYIDRPRLGGERLTGITVSRVDGEIVAVKRAVEPEPRARLRHEADMLRRIDHPGVVRLVDFDDGPPATLRTVFVGPDSWAGCEPEADALAVVTATVADLHEAGLTHGGLHPAHVLVDHAGAPVLCGLADAGPATPERVRADRSALATLVRSRAEHLRGAERDRLLDAAAALDEPALPTRAAVRLLDAAPARAHHSGRRSVGATAATAGGAALVIVAAVLVGARWFGPSDGGADTSRPPPVEAGTTAPIEPRPATAPPPNRSPEPPPTRDPAAPLAVDVIAGEGLTVEHAGRRYAIGVPGDEIVIADWTCTGDPTPALLRPSTGEVVVFTRWPGPGDAVEPTITTIVDDAIEIATSDLPCPDLRIRTPDGSRLIDVPSP